MIQFIKHKKTRTIHATFGMESVRSTTRTDWTSKGKGEEKIVMMMDCECRHCLKFEDVEFIEFDIAAEKKKSARKQKLCTHCEHWLHGWNAAIERVK